MKDLQDLIIKCGDFLINFFFLCGLGFIVWVYLISEFNILGFILCFIALIFIFYITFVFIDIKDCLNDILEVLKKEEGE